MTDIIERNRQGIEELCRRYQAIRLEVFGSAAEDSFTPESSDIDFLVEFAPHIDLGPWMARYFDFREELERLLGCRVDLVMKSALKNPYFIREINRTRKLLYAA